LKVGKKECFTSKKGGSATFIVPPQLGYGDYDLDAIPPNSILIFNISIKNVN